MLDTIVNYVMPTICVGAYLLYNVYLSPEAREHQRCMRVAKALCTLREAEDRNGFRILLIPS